MAMEVTQIFHQLPLEDVVLRLMSALLLGMLMGVEREVHGRPAGLRTHGLVSIGSALFTLISIGMLGQRADPGRIAAGVVTGIGFLGAGTIMRYGFSVYGLTTAASIWAAAAVGMACGVGWLPAALIATATVLLTLALLRPISIGIRPHPAQVAIHVTAHSVSGVLSDIAQVAERFGAMLQRIEMGTEEEDMQRLTVYLRVPRERAANELVAAICSLEGVADAEIVA